MTQNNEQTFFNENGIYISQFRFVTPGGQTFPTRTLQRTYMSEVRPRGCLVQMVLLFLIILGSTAIFPFIVGTLLLILWYAGEGTREELLTLFEDMDNPVIVIWVVPMLSALTLITVIVGWKITLSCRRRRWTANFMFAGGGDFSTEGGGGVSAYTTREPDYSVWSYDRQWTERLVAAANEAIVATQQT